MLSPSFMGHLVICVLVSVVLNLLLTCDTRSAMVRNCDTKNNDTTLAKTNEKDILNTEIQQ